MREKIDMLGYKMEEVLIGLLFILIAIPLVCIFAFEVVVVIGGICYLVGCKFGLIATIITVVLTIIKSVHFVKCLDIF